MTVKLNKIYFTQIRIFAFIFKILHKNKMYVKLALKLTNLNILTITLIVAF